MASPEASMLSEQLRSIKPAPDAPARPLAELRAAADMLGSMIPAPDDVGVVVLEAAGVAYEQLTPPGAADDAVLLYFHGGGFVSGSAASYRAFPARLAAAAGITAVSVDYRLAPEHPYPAVLDDCLAVYTHLLGQGIAPERIAFAGDSAGGFLVVGVMLEARRRDLPLPACGVALSPWFDLALAGTTMTAKAEEDPIGRRADLAECVRLFLPDGVEAAAVGPLAADIAGLPPILIHVGTAEVLLDDATRFEEQARGCGVDVTVHTWDGLFHIFPFFGLLPEAEQATGEAVEFLGKHLR